MNPSVSGLQKRGQERVNFKCSDVGLKNCDFQMSGSSEQEIMPKIEQHSLAKHGLRMDDETRQGTQRDPQTTGQSCSCSRIMSST